MEDEADIRVYNPQKQISTEITLDALIRHRDALKQARTGELKGVEMEKIRDNVRKMNQVRALNLIIASQREMVTISRPMIQFRSMHKWKKQNRVVIGKDKKEKKKEVKFEDFDCDYNDLLKLLDFLIYCEETIIKADETRSLKDDFMVIKRTHEGDIYTLTKNFRDMLEDLEYSYEKIYLLMLTNKIVSAGIEEDEEMTYKEKEQEAIRRVVEA